jgi:hypothetical protein
MRHSTPMILLALLTAVVPGCNCLNDLDRYSFEGDDDMGPTDQGPDMGEDDAGQDAGEDGGGTITECNDLGAPTEYEIDSLVIPTTRDVVGGAALGHDVDMAGSACGVTDYQGNVDNSLLELAQALPALSVTSPIHLQGDIDTGLTCSLANTSCAAPPWTIQVRRGTNCAQITILHGRTDALLAGPFLASVDGLGNVRGEFDSLRWVVSHLLVAGGRVDVPFVIRDGIFTARIGELLLSDIVIGGSLLRTEVEATFAQVIDDLSDGTLEFEDVAPIFASLYDVDVAGTCERLSVGLRASASRCPNTGAPVLYRLTTLHIPTSAEANGSGTAGHDVDGRGSECGVNDYVGNVDNVLVELAAAIPAFSPNSPVSLQSEIDDALACAVSGATCTRMDIYVSIAAADECALVTIQDAQDATYAQPPSVGALSNGELSVRLPKWTLLLPAFHNGLSTLLVAPLESVILTADVSASALTNVVIGGYTGDGGFESFMMAMVPFFGGDVDYDDIEPILMHLIDVERFGMCSRFSMGFIATGTAVP